MYRYDVECTCNYIEAELFSIMAGMDKDKKNIRKNTQQQKVLTKNMVQKQEKHHNCQPQLDIPGSPSSIMWPISRLP